MQNKFIECNVIDKKGDSIKFSISKKKRNDSSNSISPSSNSIWTFP